MDNYIIAVGDFVEGFTFYGPFETYEDAEDYSNARLDKFSILPLYDYRDDA